MFDLERFRRWQIEARQRQAMDAIARAQKEAAARAAAARAVAAAEAARRTRPTWTQWRIVNGMWVSKQMNGTAPKRGRRRMWADEAVGYDSQGRAILRRTSHWVYPTLDRSRTSGNTTSATSPGSGTAKKTVQRRPLYQQRERYFNAATGKWAWRTRYIPTNAEIQARQRGLRHDSRGYYREVGGDRRYVTGRVGDRRYHMEGGQRVWDDPSRWPWETSRRRNRLKDKREELKNRLDSLKDQYKDARRDQHILRRNIVRRINETERSLDRVTNALKRLPVVNPFKLRSTEKKYRGAISVVIDFAIEPDNDADPLVFGEMNVPRNANVWVRASITLLDRDWKPGRLAAPFMIRTRWDWPKGWLKRDDVPQSTDEYMVSNPLQLIRVFRSPGTGDKTPTFTCRAYVYEWAFGNPGGVQHKVGT